MAKSLHKKLTELRAAQTLLQKAHDYIELNGFNINHYEGIPGSPEEGQCCYIGTVRKVAGLDATPPSTTYAGDLLINTADEGDGPELTRAFKILDSIAARRLKAERKSTLKAEWDKLTGRVVEALGFVLQEEGEGQKAQADYALQIFRTALTKVYKQIESLEAELA